MLEGLPYVEERESALEALQRLEGAGLTMAPVRRDGGGLAGVLRLRPARDALAGASHPDRLTAGVLATGERPLEPSDDLEHAQAALSERRTASLPVVDGGEPVGIVTTPQVTMGLETERELGPLIGSVIRDISPADEMFAAGRNRTSYMWVAASALACVRHALEAAGTSPVRSVLDFGCGHGRVLRVLKAAFPDASLTASDIDPGAVEFCASTFGAAPVLSTFDPRQVRMEGSFDLVWAGSVFTHLDRERFTGFLTVLGSLLAPGGVLVLTVPGNGVADDLRRNDPIYRLTPEQTEELLRGRERDGFAYVEYEPGRRYGHALVIADWVRDAVASAGGLRLLDYREAAWGSRQDVVACVEAS